MTNTNQSNMASNKNIGLFSMYLLLLLVNFHSAVAQSVNGGYWFPASEFPVANINATLFTHLFCAFANLNPQTNQLTVAQGDQNAFSTFTLTVQLKNPSVKTLLSIGGGNAISADYAAMATQASSRKAFIDSSIKLARQYKFHGLDLDWEYPSTQVEMNNMGVLFNEWRAAIVAESTATNQPQLLLAAAVGFSAIHDGLNYPVQSINRSLDFINVMAYDFYGPGWSAVTRGHAVLRDPSSAVSGSGGINSWIQAGMSAKKLVLGFPYYGYGWKLANPSVHGVDAPATGAAFPGDSTITYKAIKEFIVSNKATVVHNATQSFDYCYSGTTWIGYDDTPTITEKVSFAKTTGLRGYFAWHVANDDNWVLSKEAARVWKAQDLEVQKVQEEGSSYEE